MTFPSKAKYLLLPILLIAAALRFYHIDYQSVWLDEICTINEANPNLLWSDLEATVMVSDPHPTLYFALLKIMFVIFGYTTLVARVFSAIVGVVGIYAMFLLGKEIKNSRVGLIGAALLAVNYFHIYHSQEVRMYGLLMLFTTLSFYGLLRFLNRVNTKNAIVYGLWTGLMLATQFFGLFVLIAQLFILLVYFVRTDKTEKKNFFIKSLLAGGIMILLFLPGLNIFIETTKKKYAAIAPTTIETIKQIFKDFAQESNFVILLAGAAIAVYIIMAIKNRAGRKVHDSKALFVLLAWIAITMIVPIIRSYLVTPMINSRYFITILPAVLLLVALGICSIKTKAIGYAFLGVLTVYTLFHLIYSTKYYSSVNKTQFREITQFILAENPNKEPVVSNLPWYLIYLLNNNQPKPTPIIDNTLDEYVTEMKGNPLKMNSFWFVAAFGNTLDVTAESAKFIDEHFTLDKHLYLFDANTRYYKLKSGGSATSGFDESSITLCAITDDNWSGGVGTAYNMLLLTHSEETEKLIKGALGMKFKDGRTVPITGYQKVGTYIHLYIQGNVGDYKDVAAYPNQIMVIRKTN